MPACPSRLVGSRAGGLEWILGCIQVSWDLHGKVLGVEVDTGQASPGLGCGCHLGGMARVGVSTVWRVCAGATFAVSLECWVLFKLLSLSAETQREWVCTQTLFKSEVLDSYSSLTFRWFWNPVMEVPGAVPHGCGGAQWWGSNPSLLTEDLQVCNIPFCSWVACQGYGSPSTHFSEVFFHISYILEEMLY